AEALSQRQRVDGLNTVSMADSDLRLVALHLTDHVNACASGTEGLGLEVELLQTRLAHKSGARLYGSRCSVGVPRLGGDEQANLRTHATRGAFGGDDARLHLGERGGVIPTGSGAGELT